MWTRKLSTILFQKYVVRMENFLVQSAKDMGMQTSSDRFWILCTKILPQKNTCLKTELDLHASEASPDPQHDRCFVFPGQWTSQDDWRGQAARFMSASHQLLEMQQLKSCSYHRPSHIGSLEPHAIAKATTSIDTFSEWDTSSSQATLQYIW